ncbi:MAG: porin family protein [Saprospiraceae bacterium]
MKNTFKLKIIWAIICSVFVIVQGQAQSETKVGFRAGVLMSKFDYQNGNLDVNTKSKLGLDLGLVADFPVGSGDVVFISPEFHWLQKGGKIEDLTGTVGEITSTLNYLEVPLMLKLRFGQQDVGFMLFAGPSFGYLLDGSNSDNSFDLDAYKKIELGMHAGGGIAVGPIVIDLRYIYGISNISDSEIDVKNRGLGAGISLVF